MLNNSKRKKIPFQKYFSLNKLSYKSFMSKDYFKVEKFEKYNINLFKNKKQAYKINLHMQKCKYR